MSGLEIERKFLVKKGDAYKSAAFSSSHIQQGYIPADGATVRIRTRDDKAYLTIKGKSVNGGMTRYEFEKEIEMDEAQHLLQRFYNSHLLSYPFAIWRNTLPEEYR